jgi:hypothetical protein
MSKSITILPEWLDVDATIQQFGYSPLDISPKSNKPVMALCQHCGISHLVRKKCDVRALCEPCGKKESIRKRTFSGELNLVPSYVDIQETIKQFGYDPCLLSKRSSKPVIARCYLCNKMRTISLDAATKYKACMECSYNDPHSAQKRSDSAKSRKGDRKPLPPETLQRISRLHVERIARDGIRHVKRIPYYRLDGSKVSLRSGYEVGFAVFLEASEIAWEYEPKAFMLNYSFGGVTKLSSYRPDFYLPEYDRYVEIKGYWHKKTKAKFDAFLEQYPEIDIDVIYKDVLQFIGAIKR